MDLHLCHWETGKTERSDDPKPKDRSARGAKKYHEELVKRTKGPQEKEFSVGSVWLFPILHIGDSFIIFQEEKEKCRRTKKS